uniref:Uncharacterized protein n=1 Tax=Molossus molossus TaxID=27622 RepID=A0A7J8J818_MOLMO|nr:hypothetical protein HJG59_009686 [Molossus molossus]
MARPSRRNRSSHRYISQPG